MFWQDAQHTYAPQTRTRFKVLETLMLLIARIPKNG